MAGPPPVSGDVALTPVWPELNPYRPFDFRYSPVDPDRWYFLARAGYIYTFKPGGAVTVALDIRNRIGRLNGGNWKDKGGSEEWGVVSFAFHPDFAHNGWVYVVYTGNDSDPSTPLADTNAVSRLSRFTRDPTDPSALRFDPASEKILIQQAQTGGAVHHFDHVAFGPDGLLYFGDGDGTAVNPTSFPTIQAQNPRDVHGKILRLDVDVPLNHAKGYTIPPGNPYADGVDGLPEVWAMGLRNPWRFSFDGDFIWIGDVGEYDWEEVNRADVRSPTAPNFGWSVWEGPLCRIAGQCGAAQPNFTPPVDAIESVGPGSWAVIGGFVYRGSIPDLQGSYVYAIYGQNRFYALDVDASGAVASKRQIVENASVSLSSFFVDHNNELYGVAIGASGAGVYRFDPAQGAIAGSEQWLSQTGCAKADNPKTPSPAMIPYALTAELWSDGATKQRFMAIPDGSTLKVTPDGDFDFPIGAVLMKSFLINNVFYETRLLKHHTDGSWAGYSYRWNDAQTDAELVGPAGDVRPAVTSAGAFDWRFPARSDCLVCHTEQAGFSLGPQLGTLNSIYRGGHQLANLEAMGLLDPVEGLPAPIHDLPAHHMSGNFGPIARTRAYLDANCAGCHRGPDSGAGRATIDLRYDSVNARPNDPALPSNARVTDLCDVAPGISDLGVAGAKLLTPGAPSNSILYLRINRRGDNQMPPLATQLIHSEGVSRVRNWIRRADVCDVVGDQDGDGVPDNADNCVRMANASQWDSDHDGFGNACDGDFNQDGAVDATDGGLLASAKGGACGGPAFSRFGRAPYDAKYDLNFDGLIDDRDCVLFGALLIKPPGPSAIAP